MKNVEEVAAILGLVLMTYEGYEVRIPRELVEQGLPPNSGIRIQVDEQADELVVSIQEYDSAD